MLSSEQLSSTLSTSRNAPYMNRLALTLAVLAWILVFLLQMQFGASPTSTSLDASWADVMAWGFLHHAQWGRELVFTYGPLGFLGSNAPFNPHLYWLWLGLQACMAAFIAWLVAVNLARMRWITSIGFLIASVILGLAWMSSAPWLIAYPLSLLALNRTARDAAVRLQTSAWDVLKTIALAGFAAMLTLVKFSTFPLWLVWIPAGAMVLGFRRPALLTAFLATTVSAPIIIWLACGQHLVNFPAFLRWSAEAAFYYGSAMQAPPGCSRVDVLAWITILVVVAYIGVGLWRGRRIPAEWAVAAMLALTLLLAYKAGATRADGGHLLIFWSCAIWIGVLAIGRLAEPLPRSTWFVALQLVLMALPLALLWNSRSYVGWSRNILFRGTVTQNQVELAIQQMRHPEEAYGRRLADWNKWHSALALPHIAKTVGNDSVDLMLDQVDVLLANDLDYTPRPVFQSYSTYSDSLAWLNEQFFLDSSRAPQWVILKLPAIDGRYPSADDAKALVRVLQLYRPVMQENGFLLMQRMIGKHPPPLVEATGALDEPLSFDRATTIPDADHAWFGSFKVDLTAAGKLQALLTRDPILFLKTTLAGGQTVRFRIPRAVAASGFLISPLMHSNDDYLAWLGDEEASRVSGLKLEQAYFLGRPVFKIASPLHLHTTHLDRSQRPDRVASFTHFPGFSQQPYDVIGKPSLAQVDGATVALFTGSPNQMTFAVPPGKYRVSANYGIIAGAVKNKACIAAHADGIGIAVEIAGQSPALANVAYLDPFRAQPDHVTAAFTGMLAVHKGERVTVELTKGPPGSNGACDWAWIRDVHFQPTEDGHASHQ